MHIRPDPSIIFNKSWNDLPGLLKAIDESGFALVPKEPTEPMLRAAFAKMNEAPAAYWKTVKAMKLSPRQLFDMKMRPRWAAMLEKALK